MSPTSSRRCRIRLVLSAATVALLGGCSADLGPSPMPTGYKYLNNQHRVSPLSVAPAAYSGAGDAPAAPQPVPPAAMTQPQAGGDGMDALPPSAGVSALPAATDPAMQGAAGDLLDKIEKKFGKMQDPVYVRVPATGSVGEEQFSAALARTLSSRGYKISDSEQAPFALDYSVAASGPSMAISLAVMSQAHEVARVEGQYPASAMPQASAADAMPAPAARSMPLLTPPSDGQQPAPASDRADAGPSPSPIPAPAAGGAVTTPVPDSGQAMDADERTYIFDRNAAGGKTAWEQRQQEQTVIPAPDDSGDLLPQ